MRSIKIAFILGTLSFLANGCSSRAFECVEVGEKRVCFLREVRGRNGDDVYLTTVDDKCHKPQQDRDYFSDSIGAGEAIYVKVIDKKLHIYGSSGEMIAPRTTFPVEIVFESYTANRDVENEGFVRLDLAATNTTWCWNDL